MREITVYGRSNDSETILTMRLVTDLAKDGDEATYRGFEELPYTEYRIISSVFGDDLPVVLLHDKLTGKRRAVQGLNPDAIREAMK